MSVEPRLEPHLLDPEQLTSFERTTMINKKILMGSAAGVLMPFFALNAALRIDDASWVCSCQVIDRLLETSLAIS